MQVCTSLETDNHASTPPLSFVQAGCPSCRPTNSVKTLKAQNATSSRADSASKRQQSATAKHIWQLLLQILMKMLKIFPTTT